MSLENNKKLQLDEDKSLTGKDLENKLRKQFKKIHGTPSWTSAAQKRRSLFVTTGEISASSLTLPTKKLSVSRCKDLNACKAAQCTIQSVDFYPSATVGLVASFNKKLDLFKVDGENNGHLHGHRIPRYPICKAQFTHNGSQVVLGSRRPFFYTFDLTKCTATQIAGI